MSHEFISGTDAECPRCKVTTRLRKLYSSVGYCAPCWRDLGWLR